MNYTDVYENYSFPDDFGPPDIQPIQVAALFFYGLVVLLGVPGNAVVLWVTGFCMPLSVTSLWFLNLALADFLCCLSIPMLMVPLAHDDHWHFGALACTMVKGLFYVVMYSSILQLVLISVDRWLLVNRPVWCQNNRRPRQAAAGCVAVWVLAFIGSIPQFVYTKEKAMGTEKRECITVNTGISSWVMTWFRFLMGFFLPFLIIAACHIMVYHRAETGLTRGRTRAKRTLRVIVAVILSFFVCWLPLHIVDFLYIVTPTNSENRPHVYQAHILTLCLAYFNSCLNPLLYVCLGRGFKDSMNRSIRNVLHFISEDPTTRVTITNIDTKSMSNEKEMTKI